MPAAPHLDLAFAPWRLSGVVYGTLLNDPAALAALGDAVHAAPYKAPPRAPVLYIKPRNTLSASGAVVAAPPDGALEVGVCLGLVIGRAACRVAAAEANAVIAGFLLVADLCVPHQGFYRPSVRLRARDGSCVLGATRLPRSAVAAPDALAITVSIDGRAVHTTSTAGRLRAVAQLVQDVTEFMTLAPGDVLLLGAAAGAPSVRAGQSFAVEAAGFGRLEASLVAEPVAA